MLIVAIDTSGRHGSVALCRGDAERFEVLELSELAGGTYSARLMPTIAEALQHSRLSKADLDGFTVISGPGSFTGLRVGLATVKGLCEALHKPAAAVSMLEALVAVHGNAGARTTAVLDAGRGEVYIGEYDLSAEQPRTLQERISKLNEFASEAPSLAGEIITPDGNVAQALQQESASLRLVSPVFADEIGRIGIRKLLADDTVELASMDVNYIRRSDAEIFSAPAK